MNQYNLSFGVSGDVNHAHNSRSNPPAHADPEKRANNSMQDFNADKIINAWYAKEVAEYNAKQTHKNRRIENLYQETKRKYDKAAERDKAEKTGKKYRNKTKCPEKEIIVAIGDMKEHPDEHTAKLILSYYAVEFDDRNPCFRVTGAYIHCDEANTHLHLDFAYKADKEKTINKMYSFENALHQMGYEQTKTVNNEVVSAFEQWMQAERRVLQELAKHYEIGLNDTKKDGRKKHLEREEYIQYAREQDLEKRKNGIDIEEAAIEKKLKDKKAELKQNFENVKKGYQDELDDEKAAVAAAKIEKEAAEKERDAAIRETEREKEELTKTKKELAETNEKLMETNRKIEKGNEEIEGIQEQMDLGYDELDNIEAYLRQYNEDPIGSQLNGYRAEKELETIKKNIKRYAPELENTLLKEQTAHNRNRGIDPQSR